jgi:large repetitive protein
LTSSKTQLLLTYYNHANDSPPNSPAPGGYAYACYRDITSLVRKYGEQPASGSTNYNGHGTYTVRGTLGDTGDNLSYAGWSLINIYSSPETQDHQLYLYDTFIYSSQESVSGLNVDWDGDGLPGGTIQNFIVPQQISGEINAAKISCFVGEGDDGLTGDYFAVNGTKLWDGTTSNGNSLANPNNIWNSKSSGLAQDGIDIDTPGVNPTANPPQYITWASGILVPGATSANITMFTKSDGWFMVYMMLSFRSETTTGSSLSYLIHG